MTHRTRGLAAAALISSVAVAGLALARGPDMDLPGFASPPSSFFGAPAPHVRSAERSSDEDAPRHVARTHHAVASIGGAKAVCVRLCDGFFFPTASAAGGDASCAAQCPDAPTALYTMSTDRIEDAVSSTGALYSKLPVAKRYQTSFDNTCSCRRDVVASRSKDLLRDVTLRKGDVVMTADGFRVYQGGGYGPAGESDFVALARATTVAKDERADLVAMERASAGSPAPSAPALVAARPKGRVTVENSPPAR